MADRPAVLIAAISGRALAQSAQRGGYQPLVVDFFGDQDTLQIARDHIRLTGELANGIAESALIAALEALAQLHRPVLGVVCGSGFEDRPHLLQSVAARWPLFGNHAAIVTKVKNPEMVAAICGRLAIPVPEFSFIKPDDPPDWLAKRVGGAGGAHVRPASQPTSRTFYYQRKVPGATISALFLADGACSTVIGFSAQWVLATATKPYRYGGAVRPAMLPGDMIVLLTSAVERFAAAASLVGLNSIDFHVDGDRFWLLDVNPRPGATLDIFEPSQESLFRLHMAACNGNLASAPIYPPNAKATTIVYAENHIASVPSLEWPSWTADRPQPKSVVKAGEPVCTVYACESVAATAKAVADKRRRMVLAWMQRGQG